MLPICKQYLNILNSCSKFYILPFFALYKFTGKRACLKIENFGYITHNAYRHLLLM